MRGNQRPLPEDDLVCIVLDVVAALDLGGFRRYQADGHGRPAFDPEMMVALLPPFLHHRIPDLSERGLCAAA